MAATVFIDQVQALLRPRFTVLLDALTEHPDPRLFGFFAEQLAVLNAASEEEDVIMLFVELSKAGFLGFEYDTHTWALTDELLAAAEQVAFTMTASDQQ